MVIEENKAVSRKSIASISKKSATLGAIVLGSAFAVSSLSANIDIPTVEASEGTTVTFASTNNAFLDSIIPDAHKLANDNDLYASVMIAQAILESNWGVSGLSAAPYYNLFGIKGTYNGEGVTFYTLEDDGSGNYYQIRDSFRDYPSYKESLNDYANKMVNGVSWDSEFYSGTWKSNTSSYTDATAALTGTYATDTRYGGKLNNLITTHGLTQYDTPAGSTSSTSASVSGATTNLAAQGATSSTNGGKSYTVKAGDGLYTVARALGVTVAEVKAQNGLTSNLIHPGQVLSVASSSASSSSSSASTETATNTDSSASTSGKSYTVKSGDGLYSVAKALGISVSEARSLNSDSDLIHPGQVFKAGQSATSSSSTSSSSSASANTGSSSASTSTGKSYTVKSGDGLYSVAKALGISVSEARSLNGGSDLIHPGKVFKAGQSTTSTSSSSSSSSASANTGSSSASTSGKSYTVKSGDGLYSVAKALGISVSEARSLNGGSDLIHPGKVFTAGSSGQASSSQASSSSATSTSSASTSQSSASTSGKSYTVKSGDGIYTVARALGISLAEARALNGGSDLIHPGKVFTAGSSSQASSSQATSSSATSTSSASTSQSSASTSGKSYTVKSGDGIYTVARALGISLAEARALNGGSDLIHPGKVFTTGGSSQASSSQASSSASTSSSTSTASSSATSSTKAHTVKSGETLYRIAKNNGLSLDELMALNGLSNYNLYIGQVLKLN
ncbi:LysM peptidoglycan-binding domain-containing protein [Aerococcus urinaeequi]|uniref:muramidase family protein n=1 Tax=Aerococcus urinaeequi TaxID=51665 RepID=UPI003D6A8DBF